MSKFNDVQKFFKDADLDLAEATLEIAAGLVKDRQDIRRKQVAGAARARSGKGKAKPGTAAAPATRRAAVAGAGNTPTGAVAHSHEDAAEATA